MNNDTKFDIVWIVWVTIGLILIVTFDQLITYSVTSGIILIIVVSVWRITRKGQTQTEWEKENNTARNKSHGDKAC